MSLLLLLRLNKSFHYLLRKLESFLQKKSPSVSAVVTPILNTVNGVADNAIEAAGNAAIQTSN